MSVKSVRQFTDDEIEDRIDNDTGLNDWWKSSGHSKRHFILDNRVGLEAAINAILDGKNHK